MRDILHFLKYTFKWEIRLFIIVNVLMIFSFIYLERESYPYKDLLAVGLGLCLMFYWGTSMYWINTMSSNSGGMSGLFSSKYLQSLPVSKNKLLLMLNLAGGYVLIPILISIFWIKFRYANLIKYQENEIFQDINDHFGIVIFTVIAFHIIMLLFQTAWSIELTRKSYSKTGLGNTLFYIRSLVGMAAFASLFILAIFFCIKSKATIYYFVFWIGMVAHQLFRTYISFRFENVSYWDHKRDFGIMGLYVLIIFLSSFGANEIIANHEYGKMHWKHYFLEKNDIAYEIKKENWDNVKKLLQNLERGKVNKYGVGKEHYLAYHTLYPDDIDIFSVLDEKGLIDNPIKVEGERVRCLYVTGVTPVHIAAFAGNLDFLKKTFEKYPDYIKLETESKRTPLYYATRTCSSSSVKEILDRGGEINHKDESGITPLMVSVENNCWLPTLMLLLRGADLDEKNFEGKTAYEMIEKNSNLKGLLDEFIEYKKAKQEL